MTPVLGPLTSRLAVVALSCLTAISSSAQTPPQGKASGPADYASEPFVIEQWREQARFENDGAGRLERSVRVRIQSEEGVRAWGQLVAGYNSSNERLDPPDVTVHKADGTTLPVDTSGAQDIALPIEMVAPTYTGYRQRHVAVPSLRPGDVLSFRIVRTIVQPAVAGHFWLEQDFVDGAIVLDARLTLDLPADRRVTIKVRPGVEEMTGAQQPAAGPGRRVRAWRSSNLTRAGAKSGAAADADDGSARGDETPRPPAVRMTSFESWDEIARWYAGLVAAASEPDAAIRAKAEALTRGKATPAEKIEALYDFVSREVRYVSLSLGLNQYQPHKASDTLRDQYGDCKDKHTLLASLARAVGLTVEPALIHHLSKLDPDVPSPGQFDHVISVLPTGADSAAWTWLDTTPEVAPYRVLLSSLRGQTALVAAGLKSNPLVVVPKMSAVEGSSRSEVVGTLDEQGKLDARVAVAVGGERELFWRLTFRSVPKTEWSLFAQEMQKRSWMGGTTADFTVDDPSTSRGPYRLSYRFERPNWVDRAKTEAGMHVPLERPELAFAQDKDWVNRTEPRAIVGPISDAQRARIDLPATFTARLPSNVELTRPYGRYKATYALEGRTLIAERSIVITVAEIPPSLAQDYIAFARAVQADLSQTVRLTMPPAATNAPAATGTGVAQTNRAAWEAYQARRYEESLALYAKVLEAEPKSTTAWNNRGLVRLAMNRLDEAASDFQQQIAVNAFDAYAHNNLGRVYWRQRKFDEAEAEFRKQIEINPLDDWAHRNLGQLASERGRHAEALPSLEKAASIKPDDAPLRVLLGTVYLETKAPERARASFDKAVELQPDPLIWNNVAYQMSLRDFDLERAQQFSESAIGGLAIQMRLMTLDTLKPPHVGGVASFVAYWDTLGWILFRRGDLVQAEKYLHAAWTLSPRAEIGRHLGALYEKQGRAREAMQVYAEAVSQDAHDTAARARLEALAAQLPDEVKKEQAAFSALVPPELAAPPEAVRKQQATLAGIGPPSVETLVAIGRTRLVERRTVKLGTIGPAGALPAPGATTEVFLLFDSASPAVGVKFLGAQPASELLASALRAAKYPVAWPSDAPTKVVRLAVVTCDAKRACAAVLMAPEDVRRVE